MAKTTRSRPKRRSLPDWLTEAHGLMGALGVLRDHVKIPVSLAPVLPRSFWLVINHVPNLAVELESDLERAADRNVYNVDNLRWVIEQRRSRVTQLGMLADLTVPVLRGKRVESALCCGPFLLREPDLALLHDQWQFLTGRKPSAVDARFIRYARQLLALQVLGPPEVEAFAQLCELVAQALVRGGTAERRLASSRRLRILLAKLPSSLEDKALRLIDPLANRHWKNDAFYSWEIEELPIARMPNTVIAVQPRELGASDTVESLVAGALFRRRCESFSRSLPDCLVAPFEERGAFFLVHCDPKASKLKWRLRARSLAERIADFARSQFGAAPALGIGALGGRGEDLPDLTRQAALAAGLCAHQREPFVFFDDLPSPSAIPGRPPLRRPGQVALSLRRLFRETDFGSLPGTLAEFVEAVLEDAGGRSAVARASVESLLFELWELAHERAGSDQRTRVDHRQQLLAKLESLDSLPAVMTLLREEITALEHLMGAPRRAEAELKLDRAARYIDENCARALGLREVARRAGLSPNYFSAVFKATYGTGFAEYLIERRIERARKLLRAGVLSAERIATECGFASVPHFFRAFKQRVGETPGDYRRGARGRPDPEDQSRHGQDSSL